MFRWLVAEKGDREPVAAAMLHADQPPAPIDRNERAVERAVEPILAHAAEPLLERLVPGESEAVRALDGQQAIGRAGAHPHGASRGRDRAGALQVGDEVGCVCSDQPPRRLRRRGTGVKSMGSGRSSSAPVAASRSAALRVTG